MAPWDLQRLCGKADRWILGVEGWTGAGHSYKAAGIFLEPAWKGEKGPRYRASGAPQRRCLPLASSLDHLSAPFKGWKGLSLLAGRQKAWLGCCLQSWYPGLIGSVGKLS